MSDISNLKVDDFSVHLNQTFHVKYGESESLEVELVEISTFGSVPEDDKRRQSFSIVLRSSQTDSHLPQSIYTIEHESMGTLELFLVPIGVDDKGMRYEAVFT